MLPAGWETNPEIVMLGEAEEGGTGTSLGEWSGVEWAGGRGGTASVGVRRRETATHLSWHLILLPGKGILIFRCGGLFVWLAALLVACLYVNLVRYLFCSLNKDTAMKAGVKERWRLPHTPMSKTAPHHSPKLSAFLSVDVSFPRDEGWTWPQRFIRQLGNITLWSTLRRLHLFFTASTSSRPCYIWPYCSLLQTLWR